MVELKFFVGRQAHLARLLPRSLSWKESSRQSLTHRCFQAASARGSLSSPPTRYTRKTSSSSSSRTSALPQMRARPIHLFCPLSTCAAARQKSLVYRSLRVHPGFFYRRRLPLLAATAPSQNLHLRICRTSLIEHVPVGSSLKVKFNIRGNAWQDKYFVNLQAWFVEAGDAADDFEGMGEMQGFQSHSGGAVGGAAASLNDLGQGGWNSGPSTPASDQMSAPSA